MRIREYGTSGRPVILLHGGPGAQGSMAPVARGLAGVFHILEPLQRAASGTVADHVADLHQVVEARCAPARPALVGHSWGAMLALAYAAAHPQTIGRLALIGCGTFDRQARARLEAEVAARMTPELRARFERLAQEIPDPNERRRARGRMLGEIYCHAPLAIDDELEPPEPDARDEETWRDMVRLQEAGIYPAAFRAIETPVLMLHGAGDPHPGVMIRDSLFRYLPQLEYLELQRCGHDPWRERFARDEFFALLRAWLTNSLAR